MTEKGQMPLGHLFSYSFPPRIQQGIKGVCKFSHPIYDNTMRNAKPDPQHMHTEPAYRNNQFSFLLFNAK